MRTAGLPRRVLMTADAVGGVWTYACDLSRGLAQRGVEVTLAVLGPEPSPAQRAQAGDTVIIETGLPLDWTARTPKQLSEASDAFADLANRVRPGLVHLNSPALAQSCAIEAPVLGACHSCLATWWVAVKHGEPPDDFRWRIEAQAAGVEACDALVAPSRSFAAQTAAAYGRGPFVVHNGRDAPTFEGDACEDFVFTAGRLWDEGKDVRTFDLAAVVADLPFVAAGPTRGPNDEAAVLHHASAVGALPASDVRGELAKRPIFVSTALYEPFGLSVLEAAQAGCALILSDIPTFRELWSDAALFIPPGDPAALAAAVRSLATERQQRLALGRKARVRADRYTVSAMVEGTLGLYRQLSRSRSPTHGAAA